MVPFKNPKVFWKRCRSCTQKLSFNVLAGPLPEHGLSASSGQGCRGTGFPKLAEYGVKIRSPTPPVGNRPRQLRLQETARPRGQESRVALAAHAPQS